MENIGLFFLCLVGSVVIPLLLFFPLIRTERNRPPYSNVRRFSAEGSLRALKRAEKRDRKYEERR
jgi:hypothetical protein